jgi:tetratricopeptide (TPR) repeat protein
VVGGAGFALFQLGRAPLSRFLARRDLARARQLSSRPDEAASALRSALRRDPRLGEARGALAQLEIQRGNLEDALLGFQSLAELEPDRPEGWRGLASVRVAAGQPDEALFALDRVLQADPSTTEARRERARLRDGVGQHLGALLDAKRLLEADPRDVQTWVIRIRSERWIHGERAAVDAAQGAMAQAGGDPALIAELAPTAGPMPVVPPTLKEGFADRADRWPGTLGPLMQDVGSSLRRRDWAAAAALASRARGEHPGSWLGPWLEGVIDQARGDLDAAETRLLEALALSPRSHRAVTNLAAVWSRRHDTLTGADRLVALVDADPGFEYPLPIAARTYLEADQPARAEATARRMLVAAPGSARPYGELATLYLELDRPGDALQICEQGLARFPSDPELLLREARSKASLGDHPGAIAAYDAVLARQPDHHLGAAELAILLVDVRGDADSSQRALSLVRGLRLDGPLEAEALGAIGRVALKVSKDSATALRVLELAVRGAPEDPSLRYYLGLASKLEGKPERATSELRAALQLGRPFPEEAEARKLIHELEETR